MNDLAVGPPQLLGGGCLFIHTTAPNCTNTFSVSLWRDILVIPKIHTKNQ